MRERSTAKAAPVPRSTALTINTSAHPKAVVRAEGARAEASPRKEVASAQRADRCRINSCRLRHPTAHVFATSSGVVFADCACGAGGAYSKTRGQPSRCPRGVEGRARR